MARKKDKKRSGCLLAFGVVFLVGLVFAFISIFGDYINGNKESFGVLLVLVLLLVFTIVAVVISEKIKKQRRELLLEIFKALQLDVIDLQMKEYDKEVIVKSRQALANYTDVKFFKDTDSFEDVSRILENRKNIVEKIQVFLSGNAFADRPQYGAVRNVLMNYMQRIRDYRVLVAYVSAAGNRLDEKMLHIVPSRTEYLISHPEELMTKGEYNRFLKQQSQDALEEKKHSLYNPGPTGRSS